MGNHPIWLISWLEGTRISQSKIEASHVCVATFDLYIHILLLSLSLSILLSGVPASGFDESRISLKRLRASH